MAPRTIDFDAAWEEHQRQTTQDDTDAEPEQIRMFGSVFPRRASLPAAVSLWAGRVAVAAAETAAGDDTAGDGAEVGLTDLLALLRLIVPADVLDDWVYDQGRSETELRRAFMALYALYNGVTPEAEGDGEASGEASGPASPKRSSKAGRSSKPTSRASTKRTSTG